jgi:hypothetical protein
VIPVTKTGVRVHTSVCAFDAPLIVPLEDKDFEETGKHFERLEKIRMRWVGRLIYQVKRKSMSERSLFYLEEIADYCARVPGNFELNRGERERALELLRQATLRGEFDDAKGRSRVVCLSMFPFMRAKIHLGRESAAHPDLYLKAVPYLCIRRKDCEAWFSRNGLCFPKEWEVEIAESKLGRPAEWNWPDVEIRLEIHETFSSKNELYKAIRKYAKPLRRGHRKPLNQRTITSAVKKYGWMRFARK